MFENGFITIFYVCGLTMSKKYIPISHMFPKAVQATGLYVYTSKNDTRAWVFLNTQ